ncbi:heme-containing dehydratase protein [Dactylonectria estremocensis]|uniref:Heme-containing dehydratase protein n=1 Tax=Dactylonectria estremocensis TaxID=1079267 RepID=A0A9P9JHU0_9HYPO|nr:heme-containing dehydratase protein [Dactylonectria estremocensis]
MFYKAKLQPGDKFIYGIFGIQHQGEEQSGRPAELISQFESLISDKIHLDRIIHPGKSGLGSRIWLLYWRLEKYAEWWASEPVKKFWESLSEDAGVWRETLTVSSNRTRNAVSRKHKYGINGLNDMEMFTEKIGYWGCARDRIHESSPDEQFTSPLKGMPDSRTVITDLPDNICFLVEGQDRSLMTPVERTHWFDEFDDLVTGRMQDLGDNTKENSLLSVRMGYVPEKGKFKDAQPVNLAHNRKIELFYWLDMKKFERISRVHRGHFKIWKKFMEDYCPVGKMDNGIGKITLWQETSIMKGGGGGRDSG